MDKTVAELFAGVGGFRVGLNKVSKLSADGRAIENGVYKFVWANQWEPSSKTQHAYNCYVTRFGTNDNHDNTDLCTVVKKNIPDHTLLVGGFPCQDYSVARSISGEKGINGKKGVLWWQIYEILDKKKPPFLLLENVDRLLKSPSKQRGRDFGIMLRSLNDLGYGVEWRVINAAEYGRAQRRRRVFIFGFHKSTSYFSKVSNEIIQNYTPNHGLFEKKFPTSQKDDYKVTTINISDNYFSDLVKITEGFSFNFQNSGASINGIVSTCKVEPCLETPIPLNKIIIPGNIDDRYNIDKKIDKFRQMKGRKSIDRTSKIGIKYKYSEGNMVFPDDLNKPARTMLTSEGSVNRSTHVIEDPITLKYRLITPIEAERLNDFPDDWTNTNMPIGKRYFMMGNALVCGLISKMGDAIADIINQEK